MSEIISINVEKHSFLHMLNVLCDAILEDEMFADKSKLRVSERVATTCACIGECVAVHADLAFLKELLPRMEEETPGIFHYYSPILRVLEMFKNEKEAVV